MILETITIPAAGNAPGVAVFHCSAKYFLCTALTGPFKLLTSNQDEFDFSESGSGFGNDQSPTFGKLTFYNAGGTAIDVSFYVSNSPIRISDVNVSTAITATATLANTLAACALETEQQFQKNTTGLSAIALAAAGIISGAQSSSPRRALTAPPTPATSISETRLLISRYCWRPATPGPSRPTPVASVISDPGMCPQIMPAMAFPSSTSDHEKTLPPHFVPGGLAMSG